jgi:hypothetical protein
MRIWHSIIALGFALSAVACDDPPPKKNPFEPKPKETNTPPPTSAMPKSSGVPQLAIDDLGPKVGFTRVLLERPEGKDKLAEELEAVKTHFQDKDAPVVVVRMAKMTWVVTMIDALSKIGAKRVVIKTETRKEFPTELAFTPQDKAPAAEPCSLAGMILEDRATAIWKVSGGTASKRAKGFAGPDLSTTAETIERYAKACKNSSLFFVSAAPPIEWGLAYDLAASAKKIEGIQLDTPVVLRETPTAGRKVDLGK